MNSNYISLFFSSFVCLLFFYFFFSIFHSSSINDRTLAGGPGKSIGACWDGAFFGALGVGTGGLGFFVLAKLSKSQVAQGFVFFIIVYFYSIAKALSMRYFGFSLLGIIMSFSGICEWFHSSRNNSITDPLFVFRYKYPSW